MPIRPVEARDVRPGDTILREGDPDTHIAVMWVICSGDIVEAGCEWWWHAGKSDVYRSTVVYQWRPDDLTFRVEPD